MSIELRWLRQAETTTEAPRLQYRETARDALSGFHWIQWRDVPTAVAEPVEQVRKSSES